MRKFLFCAFILALTINSKAQQYGWVDISNNLPASNGTVTLSDMYWINDNEGWICSGFIGEIYHTTDGGQTFSIQTTQYSTNAICMLNSSEGYSGGLNGRVYRTTDGGVNWVVLGTIGGPLRSISFAPSSSIGYCSGDNGKIYKITSSGVTSMYSGVNSHLKSIYFPGSEGFVCGGTIILHFDGSSWLTDQAYPSASYNGICIVSDTVGWAVGDAGVIIETTDGGISPWNYQTNPDPNYRSLYDVFFLNASEGWAVGSVGVLLHTTNGGALWTIEASGMTTNLLSAVQFTSSTNGYVLGNNKTLLKYTLLTGMNNLSSPPGFALSQNFPNPFSLNTEIGFQLEKKGHAILKVYNSMGKETVTLVDAEMLPGEHQVQFDATVMPAGVYFYQLQANGRVETKKMLIVK